MKRELMLSWRYLVTRRKEKFISLISLISVIGIAIGVMALIVVLAVMTGFDRELHDKIVGNQAHITLTGFEAIDNTQYPVIAERITSNNNVEVISPPCRGRFY